jgi:hypothetical protein
MDVLAIGFAILAVLVCVSVLVTEHRQHADIEETSRSYTDAPSPLVHDFSPSNDVAVASDVNPIHIHDAFPQVIADFTNE